ncbi:hypothetical protein G9F32_06010 [Acinetobacter sp. 194]|uniref:NF038215 family lipoprotein n=1 Tax=Acinetobacter shaoyimingii TaxID=2715164 RepID=UPI00140BB982|nr:NF038215 family lipoprotein [Acinetobacter shaoyimingii]NHB57594.1 hypothetical protein [Acinetobacter shaoyimingii]
MKKLSMILATILVSNVSLLLVACDAHDNVNRPKTEMRTMIIGGVPTHDADYQLNTRQTEQSKPVSPAKTEK